MRGREKGGLYLARRVHPAKVTPCGTRYVGADRDREGWERTLEMAEAVESEQDRAALRHRALRELGVVRG